MGAATRAIPVGESDRLDRWARQVALQLLWVIPALGLLALYFAQAFHGLYLSESMDLAQIARHISRGEGFVTSFLRPVAMMKGAAVQPEVMNPPLFALVLAVIFGVFPATDSTVAAVSSAFHVLTLIAVFALGKRVFDWRAGALAALLYGVSAQVLNSAAGGTGASMAALLCCLAFYVLLGETVDTKRAVWAGVLAGLCCLTNYAAVLLLPVLGALAYRRAKGKAAAGLAAAFAAVCTPWLIRNYLVTGDPFFTLQRYLAAMSMTTYPGRTLFRSADPSQLNMIRFAADHPTELVKKFVFGAHNIWQSGPGFLGIGIAALMVVGLFLPFKNGVPEPYRRSTYWLMGLLVTWAAVTTMTAESLALAAPVAASLAAGVLFGLITKQPAVWRAGAVVALLGIQSFPALVSTAWPPDTRNPSRQGLDYLKRAMPDRAIVVTDVPWSVAWYADKPAMWLPVTAKDFAAVQKRRQVNAIFLSWLIQTYTPSEQAWWWQEMYVAARPPEGFEVGNVFPPGDILFTRQNTAQQ